MFTTKIQHLLDIIAIAKKDYGNILHIAVYTRNLKLFNEQKTEELLKHRHDNLTPIQLAQKLNFTEFIKSENSSDKYIEVITNKKIIKEGYLHKYLNAIQGYQKRKLQLTESHLLSFSAKVTMIDISKCKAYIKKDKLFLQSEGKKFKFKGENIESWLEKINDIQTGNVTSYIPDFEDSDSNPYYYIFLCKVLYDMSGDNKLGSILKHIEPFESYLDEVFLCKEDGENYASVQGEDLVSEETFYDSCEEEFFDAESQV